ncbi:DinB family protein [Asticcacaulis solisilvae]|uniref:DinB family protein n=1 Tax=Asticcacaulis solisilvae TaxID=1217274 RepID=UPI003FD71BCE
MTLPFKAHLELMARYNQWMNGKILTTIRDVPEDGLWADRGAFFKSLMGTLNHLMVADLLWLNRMRAVKGAGLLSALDPFTVPLALNQVLHETVASYATARGTLDALFIDLIAALDEETLAEPFAYNDSRGNPHRKTLGLILSHVFNHQTHHRGQATTLMTQMGLDLGVTDIHTLVAEL